MVTGGAGFLGRVVCEELAYYQPAEIFVPGRSTTTCGSSTSIQAALTDSQAEICHPLAAVVGGIGANREKSRQVLLRQCRDGHPAHGSRPAVWRGEVRQRGDHLRVPKHTPVPFREDDLWIGYPEETNAPYGLAKKMMLVQGQAYRQQYG